jgi:hypothetical protein
VNLLKRIFRPKQQGGLSFLLKGTVYKGNWAIDDHSPHGFVVRNLKQNEEWHFDYASNGWITGINKTNKLNPTVIALNTKGFTGFAPILMDKKSIDTREKLKAEILKTKE